METLPFTTVTKWIKYLGINLPKETKDLYAENHKTLKKEIKDDTNRWGDRKRICFYVCVRLGMIKELGLIFNSGILVDYIKN